MTSFPKIAGATWLGLALASRWVNLDHLDQVPSVCVFKFWWGVSCPGCGMGRSILAAFQGQWRVSYEYHPLGMLFLMVWTGWLIRSVWGWLERKKRPSVETVPE